MPIPYLPSLRAAMDLAKPLKARMHALHYAAESERLLGVLEAEIVRRRAQQPAKEKLLRRKLPTVD